MSKKNKREYIERYEKKHYDRIMIRFPKGTKDRIKQTGQSVNGFVAQSTLNSLAERGIN